jgi:HNH endonuclease
MRSSLENLVRERARGCCEYCRLPQAYDELPFEIEHVIATQHGGSHDPTNRAWCCFACNRHKGPNLAGVDPKTRKKTWLFNPRRHKWQRHFQWNGPVLVGRTPVGRATIAVLAINLPHRVRQRAGLMDEGVFQLPLKP